MRITSINPRNLLMRQELLLCLTYRHNDQFVQEHELSGWRSESRQFSSRTRVLNH